MTARLGHVSRRLVAVLLVVVLVFLVFIARLVDVQVVEAASLKQTAAEQQKSTAVISATRGRILDRNGEVLAETVMRYKVVVDQRNVSPYEISAGGGYEEVTPSDVATQIASITGQAQAAVLSALIGTSAYSVVSEDLDVTAYEAVRALDVPWLLYESTASRSYPSGAVAGNLIGYLGDDETPLAGVEYADDTCLSGTDGEESYYRSGSSSSVRIPGSTQVDSEAEDGGDVTLTIDRDIQWYSQQVAAQTVSSTGAAWVSIVVQDVSTGDLLAVADAPSVDSSDYLASDASDRGSRSFQSSFEPGSTFKTITAASAIQEGVTTPTTDYTIPATLTTSAGTTISDAFTHGTIDLTTTGILRYSSNIGITEVGGAMSEQTRYDYLQKFGVGQSTSVEFPGESSGTLTDYTQWDVHSALTEMFGQGPVVATPVQITDVYQAIANGGERISPRLVMSCTKDGTTEENPTATPVQVVSSDTASQVVSMLENVVTQGGAPSAAVDGYRVAGKTGTAQIAENGTYIDGKYVMSFVGLAPAESPKYVVGVYAYMTSGTSWVVLPSFSSVMSYVLKKYDVEPSTTDGTVLPITQ